MDPADTGDVTVRPLHQSDEQSWGAMFRGYRSFYGLDPDDAVIDRVWSWLTDSDHELNATVAAHGGDLAGIAHWRTFPRPSRGGYGLWLDDLFVSPDHRGRGVGRTLIASLQRTAADEDLLMVRWITAEDNKPAQELYDRLASKTSWVTYDADPIRG